MPLRAQDVKKAIILHKILEKRKPEPKKDVDLGEFLQKINFKGEGVIVKGDQGYTPQKGVDYFTDDEIKSIMDEVLERATPVKGVHYFDGEKGEKGDQGEPGIDGKDADEDVVVERVLQRIPKPKDGKDGRNGKDAVIDVEGLKEELLGAFTDILEKRRIRLGDVEDLENKLSVLSQKVERNYGGHGGTMRNISYTYAGGTATLNSPYPILGELEVYAGGGRLFSESGDFTVTLNGGNRVTAVSLSAQAQDDIANGSTLIIRGK